MEQFKTVQERLSSVFETLKSECEWSNAMEATSLVRVVVSSGIGRLKDDKQRHSVIQDRLTKITGQKPKYTTARKSIASFKLREKEVIGYCVSIHSQKKNS